MGGKCHKIIAGVTPKIILMEGALKMNVVLGKVRSYSKNGESGLKQAFKALRVDIFCVG